MSQAVNYGIATLAAAASQCLLARGFGFSTQENILYNTASLVTTLAAIRWFTQCKNTYYVQKIGCPPSHGDYPQRSEKIQKIKEEGRLRDVSTILLASHALGWVAGSFASAVFGYKHNGSTLMVNGAAFGVYTLVLLGAKEIVY
jgi:hypothetical protein